MFAVVNVFFTRVMKSRNIIIVITITIIIKINNKYPNFLIQNIILAPNYLTLNFMIMIIIFLINFIIIIVIDEFAFSLKNYPTTLTLICIDVGD